MWLVRVNQQVSGPADGKRRRMWKRSNEQFPAGEMERARKIQEVIPWAITGGASR
jgi:hypothetical protein